MSKMKTFIVVTEATMRFTYEVEASSEKEAKRAVSMGEADNDLLHEDYDRPVTVISVEEVDSDDKDES